MITAILLGAAHTHVNYLLAEVAATSDLTVVAAADPDRANRSTLLAGPVAPVLDDARAALDAHPAQVAVLCGIYGARADLVVECLNRGMAVLADKPLCTSLDQLTMISNTLAASSGSLSVIFDKRLTPETRALVDLVDAGELGDLAMVASTGPHKLLRHCCPEWFFSRAGDGGIANDLPVHDIDILLQLTHARSGRVSALTGNRALPELTEFDDHVAVLLQVAPDPDAAPRLFTAADDRRQLAAATGIGRARHYRMRVIGTRGAAKLVDWGLRRPHGDHS